MRDLYTSQFLYKVHMKTFATLEYSKQLLTSLQLYLTYPLLDFISSIYLGILKHFTIPGNL